MKRRNPFMVLFLSIITLGIYDVYWLVKTKAVLNQKTKIHTPSILLIFVPIVIVVALIIGVIIVYMHHSAVTPAIGYGAPAPSFSDKYGPLLILSLDLFAFLVIVPTTFYWFFKFSKAINEYTNGELSTGVAFLLLWLLHFIGLIIVQDKFNDMLDAGYASPQLRPNPMAMGVPPSSGMPVQPVTSWSTPLPPQPINNIPGQYMPPVPVVFGPQPNVAQPEQKDRDQNGPVYPPN